MLQVAAHEGVHASALLAAQVVQQPAQVGHVDESRILDVDQPRDPICRCPAAEQLVSGCFQVTRPCLGRAEECERGCYEVGGGCKCPFRISLAVPGTEGWGELGLLPSFQRRVLHGRLKALHARRGADAAAVRSIPAGVARVERDALGQHLEAALVVARERQHPAGGADQEGGVGVELEGPLRVLAAAVCRERGREGG